MSTFVLPRCESGGDFLTFEIENEMLIFIIALHLDTIPVKPLPVLLPRPVKSEKTKSDDKDSKKHNDRARVVRVCPVPLAAR